LFKPILKYSACSRKYSER